MMLIKIIYLIFLINLSIEHGDCSHLHYPKPNGFVENKAVTAEKIREIDLINSKNLATIENDREHFKTKKSPEHEIFTF
jgi:hypothetical protein